MIGTQFFHARGIIADARIIDQHVQVVEMRLEPSDGIHYRRFVPDIQGYGVDIVARRRQLLVSFV